VLCGLRPPLEPSARRRSISSVRFAIGLDLFGADDSSCCGIEVYPIEISADLDATDGRIEVAQILIVKTFVLASSFGKRCYRPS
jgi:hypothetical protein